jgi:hypothetical protein
MYCPKCGQEQSADVPNFCSRCGFQLTEVTSLVARGGAPAEIQESKPPRDKLKRCGRRFLMATAVFFVFALISAANEGEAGVALFGMLTFFSFFAGVFTLIAAAVRRRKRRSRETAAAGQQTSRVEAPSRGVLSAYVPPATVPKRRLDTGELVEPPSVTEHTTRQLEHESPRER